MRLLGAGEAHKVFSVFASVVCQVPNCVTLMLRAMGDEYRFIVVTGNQTPDQIWTRWF